MLKTIKIKETNQVNNNFIFYEKIYVRKKMLLQNINFNSLYKRIK